MGVPYVVAKGVGVSRARYYPGATRTHVKLLAEPGTLRLIGGFEEPTSGLIELRGVDVTWLPPFKRNVNTANPNMVGA